MSKTIWVGISPGPSDTRILANDGATALLKARLSCTPAHPRAMQWLLESLALWQGTAVRAVLSAAPSDEGFAPRLYRDWFPDFGGPLYVIEWTDRVRRRARRDELCGLGDFSDLKRLQWLDLLESAR